MYSIKSKGYATYTNWQKIWYWNNYNQRVSTIFGSGTAAVVPIQQLKGKDFVVGTTKGLNLITRNPNSSGDNESITARITKDFCSGYMQRNIAGAWLADTTAEAMSESGYTNLLTNGSDWTGASGTTAPNGWTSFGFAQSVFTIDSGRLKIGNGAANNATALHQNITTVVGTTYTLYFNYERHSSAQYAIIRVGTATLNGGLGYLYGTATSNTHSSLTFVATTTSTNVSVQLQAASGNAHIWVDTMYVKAVGSADRGPKADIAAYGTGLALYGSVTKTKVAKNSDLVYYSGFSANNYLKQPYNANLEFGTGDFYVMYWVNFTQNNAYDNIMGRRYHDGSNYSGEGWYLEMGANNNVTMKLSSSGASRAALDGDTAYNVWQHHCFMRVNGKGHSFRNGVRSNNTYTFTENLNNTNAVLVVGRVVHGTDDADKTKLALVRMAGDSLTEEQVKKMYLEEKKLFEPDAKCTLYGTSDTITAMAYDDSTGVFHAGTSSGRSDFRGLTRINNTTTAVTTAISASNGFIAEQ